MEKTNTGSCVMSIKEIEEVLLRANVDSGINIIYGQWIVTNAGDIINLENSYDIYSYQIETMTFEHFFEKNWFKGVVVKDFIRAHKKACEILGLDVELKGLV